MLELLEEWRIDHPTLFLILRALVSPALVLLTGWLLIQDTFNSLFGTALNYAAPDIHWWLLFPFALSLGFFVVCVQPARTSITRGSSHWATLAELRSAHLINTPSAPLAAVPQLPAAGGTTAASPMDTLESILEVGRRGKYTIALTERQQESHVLIVAPTGKRKSSGFFIPALLQERGHRSLLINDVKGELYQMCAGALSRYHDIWVYSPTRPARSHGYNPLAYIETSKDARDFASTWVSNTGISREAFYNVASTVLITALVLHLIDSEREPPLYRLAELAIKPLAELKAILLSSSERARNTAAPFLQTIDMDPRLASGISLGVSNRFSLLIDSPDYRQVTATNQIHFEQMTDGPRPVALFLNVPVSAAKDLRAPTSSLIMQLMKFLTRRAEQEPGGRLPRSFALYLDELLNAGRINDLEEYITYVRGEGVSVIGAAQDFGQIDRVYGPEIRNTFLSNFTTQIVLPGIGEREGDYYSRRLGTTTVETTSTTKSNNQGSGNQEGLLSLFASQPTSTTTSETQRALMLPEELRTMPLGSFVMISDNAPPVRGQFRTYIERPELQALLNLPIEPNRNPLNVSTTVTPSAPTIPNTPQPQTSFHSTLPPPEHLY